MTEKSKEQRLMAALKYLWNKRDRTDPVFVYVDYTTRRKVRGIIGRELSEELDRHDR